MIFNVRRYYRPEELHVLTSKTHFSPKEVKYIYRGFKQECPTGVVDEESFLGIFSQFFPLGDSTNYAHHVYKTLMMREKHVIGRVGFETFVVLLSQLSRGTLDEKLSWVFELYDVDGDGGITKEELVEVVTSIYEMLGRATEPTVDETSAKDHAERLFGIIDTDEDGIISKDELVAWCSKDENVLRSLLETMDTVL